MTQTNSKTVKLCTLYIYKGEWCYALSIDGNYDHSDGLGVRQSDGWDTAIEALREQIVDLPEDAEWTRARPSRSGQGGEMQTEWEVRS